MNMIFLILILPILFIHVDFFFAGPVAAPLFVFLLVLVIANIIASSPVATLESIPKFIGGY